MIVEDVRVYDRDGACELSASLRSTGLAADGERVWIRFPRELHPRELDASPYIPGLLLASMSLHEPLTIDGPVSPRLLAAAERAKDLYRSWKPETADIRIEAEPRELEAGEATTACFFTMGVDSWYSVLSGIAGGAREPDPPITKLIYSPTSDFFAGRPAEAFQRELRTRSTGLVREASERVGCELVAIDSNLRELVEPHCGWAWTHGAVFVSMALAVGSHLTRVHIAGADMLADLVPLGSHPDLDPLWSTERTEIVHDGADVTRAQKVRFLADHPVALERLKVCINQSADGNCGRCMKCLRTRIALRLAEPLQATPSFDEPFRLRRVAELHTVYALDRAFHYELTEEVRREGGHLGLRAALWCAGALGPLRGARRRARDLRHRWVGAARGSRPRVSRP